MNEGYIVVTVPAVTQKICAGCPHYSHVLAKSGYNPIYKTDCLHPSAIPMTNGLTGNIISDYTPNWCPVGERKI